MAKSEQNKSKSNFIEEKFLPVAARIGSQRHLIAMRDGIVMVMPRILILWPEHLAKTGWRLKALL